MSSAPVYGLCRRLLARAVALSGSEVASTSTTCIRINQNSRALLAAPSLVLSDNEHVEHRTKRPHLECEEVVVVLPRIEDQRPKSTRQPPD